MTDEVAIRQEGTNIALPWFDGGCSVIPIRNDGTKRPTIKWDSYQTNRPTAREVANWWRGRDRGVAVICGKVSGNLEMLEIEGGWTDAESLSTISDFCEASGVRQVWEDLLLRGYAEWSPSGGIHVLYRLKDAEVPGNTKLAMTADAMPKTKAETRGEGGYVIVAPTGGQCHPSGQPWTTVAGEPGLIPYLTLAERDAIHAAITAALDESPPPAPPVQAAKRDVLLPASGVRPGDQYNVQVQWPEILEPHGWQVSEQRGQETLWVRPDKNRRDGHSASTGYANDADRMYVWSTSAGLPTEQPLSKFFVYTALNHGGNFREATRTLSRLGFGEQARTQTADWATSPPSAGTVALTAGPDLSGTVAIDELASVGEVPLPAAVRYTRSDSGNADHMREALDAHHRYSPQRKKWLIFSGGIWKVDYQGILVKEAIDQEFKRLYAAAVAAGDEGGTKFYLSCLSDSRINATADRMRGRQEIFVEVHQFDATPEILNLENATIDLVEGTVWEHNPKDLLTKKMNVSFNPDATSPRWNQFLTEVLPDKEMRLFLQRLVGYALTGEPVERALVILHGPGGTGKSKLVEVLTTLFGTYGTTAADSLFRSKRDQVPGVTNDLNDLKGARLASVSELDVNIRLDEALVKRLTGFDTLTSRGLYEENTSWRPQCVIWLATNHMPRIKSDDSAIWDRMKIITMDQVISEDNKDPHLLKKLLAEREGIFNWMLEGLEMYRKEGLRQPEGSLAAMKAHQIEQDPASQFIAELVYEDRLVVEGVPEEMVSKTTLYAHYVQWAKEQGEFVLGKTRFNRRVEDLGYREHKRGIMYWKGMRMVDVGSGIMGTM